jgi:hypothetical protein
MSAPGSDTRQKPVEEIGMEIKQLARFTERLREDVRDINERFSEKVLKQSEEAHEAKARKMSECAKSIIGLTTFKNVDTLGSRILLYLAESKRAVNESEIYEKFDKEADDDRTRLTILLLKRCGLADEYVDGGDECKSGRWVVELQPLGKEVATQLRERNDAIMRQCQRAY